jgi:hypothetical protein
MSAASDTVLARDRAALDVYADESDRQKFAASIGEQVEMMQRVLAAIVTVQHWRWTQPVGVQIRRFDAAIAAGMGEAFVKRATADFGLAAIGKDLREVLRSRLDREQTLLNAFGQASDPLHEETLVDISKWRKRIEDTARVVDSVAALKDEIVANADNAGWDASRADDDTAAVADGLKELDAIAATPPLRSAFGDFLDRAETLAMLRLEAVGNSPPPQPLSPEAAETLVRDCKALLTLDERAGEQICGHASEALQFALDRTDAATAPDSTRGGESGPSSPPDGPRFDGPDAGLSAALKARLKFTSAVPGVVPEKAGPPLDVQNVHVEALKARIGEISRRHAQASVHGFLEQVARLEVQLEYIHEVIRIASPGTLPNRLRDPLALLSRADAEAALRDVVRLQRMLSRNLTLIPTSPELIIAAKVLSDREKRLEKILADLPTNADFAVVVRKIDPEKAKSLISDMPSKVANLAMRRLNTWAENFKGVAARFETWRGPRGPPDFNSKFPRSQRVLAAIEMIGRNPTDAIRAFSALLAEHTEFYRELIAGDNVIAKSWEFGRKNPRSWIVSLLSPADLANAAAVLKNVARVPPTLAVAEGWKELVDAAERMQDAINAEAKYRVETAGRHPPGYPPGRPPSVFSVAERYGPDWSKRSAIPIEQQIRLQTARLMYPDPTAMPDALRQEICGIVNGVLNAEIDRLNAVFIALYGSDDRDGLLDRAARSLDKIPETEMAALLAAKQKLHRAADTIAARVATAENDRYVDVDPKRWELIVGWFGSSGRDPPSTGAAVGPPHPKTPSGAGGAEFLFSSVELERDFIELAATLESAEASLKAAEAITARSIIPPLVGNEKGRALADRQKWSNGNFSFERMIVGTESRTLNRYPEDLRDWAGFSDSNKKPFDFNRYVKNFTNFRGVGGGIHFGETAIPEDGADLAVKKGAALSYDSKTGMLSLKLSAGRSYFYGPVAPRVLKALFTYVKSAPGINLAVTIGATGDRRVTREKNRTPILLDPHFVDTEVGQDLYLADTVPWVLDQPTLPNGRSNPATEDFRTANQARMSEERLQTDRIADILGPIQPLSAVRAEELRALLDSKKPAYAYFLLSAWPRAFPN